MANPEASEDELVGWKAIAARLRVSVRTAQDLEKTKGLPIHRGAGERARVFARVTELDDWQQRSKSPSSVNFSTDWSEELLIQIERSTTNISNKVSKRFFDGYFGIALSAALLVAGMLATTVVTELAYAYDHYRAVIWIVTPLVFLEGLSVSSSH